MTEMKKDEIEQTQYLKVQNTPEKESAYTPEKLGGEYDRDFGQSQLKRQGAEATETLLQQSLEETQIMAPIAEKYDAQHPDVRELKPLPEKTTSKPKKKMPPKKIWFLVIGFLVALFAGFLLSSNRMDKQSLAENDRVHQQQAMQKDLVEQKKALEEEKVQLERQKAELAEKQQQASSRSAQLNEQSDSILNDVQSASGVKRLWNKVTGKEKEQKEAAAQSASSAATAGQEAASLKESLNQAESMLDGVNKKIDEVDSMRKQVGQVKAAAESAYQNHADLIDQAAVYLQQGKELLQVILRN